VIAAGVAAAALNDAFTLLETRPASGAGLNPLLKSPWLYPHPLSTFGGYALLAVAAVGLLAGASRRRSWIVYEAGWALLTLGIMLGAYWSYETFGWGGYWAWDPVETSELMVWLAATMLAHMLVAASSMTGFAAAYTASTVFLAMFVTRTGLSPLHSFAAPGVGALVLLAAALGFLGYSLYRLSLEAVDAAGEVASRLRSRKLYHFGMLVAAFSLLVAAVFVFASLFVPSLLVAAGHQASVPQMAAGVRYFHPVLYPLLLVMLAALPAAFIGEWLGWNGYAALVATTAATSAAFALAAYRRVIDLAPLSPASTNAMMAAGLPWAGLAAGAALAYLYLRLRRGGSLVLLRDRMVPMSLLHLGLAVTVIGVLLSGTYAFNQSYQWTLSLKPGDSVTLPGGSKLVFEDYSFGISSSKVDIFTNYVGRSQVYFWAWQGLQALAFDLGHVIQLYNKGAKAFEDNATLKLLAGLSKESPIEMPRLSENVEAKIYMLVFDIQGGNTSRTLLYNGPLNLTMLHPQLQVGFDINVDPKTQLPYAVANAAANAETLLARLASNASLKETKIGVHQALEVVFEKPLRIPVNGSIWLEADKLTIYSSALVAAGQSGEPIIVKGSVVNGTNVLAVVIGRLHAGNQTLSMPMNLGSEVAMYVLVNQNPGAVQLIHELEKTDIYKLLSNPMSIVNLTVSKTCLAAPSGCAGYVAAPRTIPETAWLDVRLRIETPHGAREAKVRIRFEAYGEIQGIHGLVSKVIHPSVGLDDVYVVVSPPVKPGELSGSPYHELMLYYMHEMYKQLPPAKKLALTALMAAGYNLDMLNRLGFQSQEAITRLEQSIVDLYLSASRYSPENSTLKTEGLSVQVKVIPGVRLVWLGPVLMAAGAVYAAAVSLIASRRGSA
jgi:cytochrome c-type biogenesis protein CcmF